MNILPKKSWHVRTKRNIERVRRDEANAAAEEKAKEERRLLAEQEARTAYLRAKAKCKEHDRNKPAKETSGHINFFEDAEQGRKYFGNVNKEHEEEKKAEQEKFEKQIGLLTYLGQSEEKRPWYLKSHSERQEKEEETDRNDKKKSHIDPLNDIRQYLDQWKKKPSTSTEHSQKSLEASSAVSKHKHKHKKQKKKSKDKTNKKTIEELRKERLERERIERKRAQDLLRKRRDDQASSSTSSQGAQPVEIQQQYNSQFNPHLARQNLLQ